MPGVVFRRLYRQTILALGAVAILSLPGGFLFYHRLNQEKVASDRLTKVRQEIGEIDELLTQLLNLETGVRGYVSTKDARFLDPYWEGKKRIPVILNQAGFDTDTLRIHINQVIALSDQTIQTPTRERLEEGKAVMDKIRVLLSELKAEDELHRDTLLERRQHREQRDLILTVVACSSTGLLLWLIYQSADNMKRTFYRAEEALQLEEAARKQEQALSEAKSAIIQTISHEYRTPLAAIRTAVELIERRPEKSAVYVQQIKQGVDRLTGLVDDVLSIFQLQSSSVILNPKQIDLRRWFAELAYTTGQSDRVGLNIQQFSILADESLLYRIFSNLLGNALKYSEGIVLVRVRQLPSGGTEFSIKDEGIGIPLATRLYQPFERGNNVGQIQGTGLGLSIVKKAVDLLDGQIKIDSREGEGTEILVILPG